jgi:hypothetical protein
MKKKFKSSPYNYCDYRCEQCEERDHCRVYKEDHERLLDHYVKGEDPHDPEIFASDLKEIFEKTTKMLSEIAQEKGIDLDPVPEEEVPRIDPHDYIIYRLAHEYCRQSHMLIKSLQKDGIPEPIESEYSDFVWYHTLLPAKVGRLVSGFADDLRDEEFRQAEEEGTLQVIAKSIRLSKKALEVMLNEIPDEFESIAGLLDLVKRLEKQISDNMRKKVQGSE